jgi:hypothetical protein
VYPLEELGDGSNPPFLGWMLQRDIRDGLADLGLVTFDGLAWIDANGVLIARDEFTVEDMESEVVKGFNGWEESEDNLTLSFTAGRFNLDSRGVPCEGVDPSALEDASIVFVHGYGPNSDEMTWSWTRLPEAS